MEKDNGNQENTGWSGREEATKLEREKTESDEVTRIAIDGPAGTGKSTVARLVAERLGVPLLNSGQLYRSVAHLAMEQGLNLDDPDQASAVAAAMEVELENGMVASLNGQNVIGQLDSDDLSAATPKIAKHSGVREVVANIQREYAKEHGAVMEGRAIGTAVMPEAQFKFYLTCDPEERARRRGIDGFSESAEELIERDREDTERANAPLKQAEDAIVIDTTNYSAEEVAGQIVNTVEDQSQSNVQ